jgi:tRNA(Ile)-lysidine synthase
VGVAVSGGADSVALLLLLLELQSQLGLVICVIHVNHMLRGRSSHTDEKFVAALANNRNLEYFSKKIDVAPIARKQKANVEDVARRERYAFFEELVRSGRVDKIAVAHTADDQAETVLAHILRGTGLSGLQGIHPETLVVFRPLLEVRRAELRSYLKKLKQPWREDATNQDTKRTRARIRKKLLPVLEKDFNPRVVDHLCQLAQMAGEAEDFLEARAAQWINDSARQKEKIEIEIRLAAFLQAPRALQTRILRAAMARVKTKGGQLSKEHVDAALQLALQKESGKALHLPAGVEVRREREALRFKAIQRETDSAKGPSNRTLRIKSICRAGNRSCKLWNFPAYCASRRLTGLRKGETRQTGAVLDLDRLRQPLVLRAWKPGTRCVRVATRKRTPWRGF